MSAVRAHRRLVARAHAWLGPHERVWCPRLLGPDRMHDLTLSSPLLEHGVIRCSYRPDQHSGKCGAQVYVMQLDGGERYVAQIEQHEVAYLEKAKLSVEETLAYLTGSPVSVTTNLRRRGIMKLTTRTDD